MRLFTKIYGITVITIKIVDLVSTDNTIGDLIKINGIRIKVVVPFQITVFN